MKKSRWVLSVPAIAAAALAVSACVQTNVGRAPRDESNEPRPVERPTAASTPAFSIPPSPSPTSSTAAPETPPLPPVPASTAPAAPAAPEPASPPPAPDSSRTPSPAAPAPATERVGDPFVLQAAPCRAEGRHVRISIPRPEALDPSHRGPAPGIEIRRTLRAGTAGVRHAKLANGVFEADLWARGAGIAVGALGTESCKGGEAADVTFEVIAHYR